MKTKPIIAVVGERQASRAIKKLAYEVGKLLAEKGAVLICGGLTGVMEEAARGAFEAGGIVIGILPGDNKNSANKYITIPIATGIGYARNAIIARAADSLIAVGGKYGTLSEIAFALAWKKKVYGLKTWDIPGVIKVKCAEHAVKFALL